MTADEVRGLMDAVGDVMRVYVAKCLDDATRPLLQRLAQLEAAAAPRDGRDGRDGQPGAKGEPGTDGRDGRDGIDGLGFDDLQVLQGDDARHVVFRFSRGDVITGETHVKDYALVFPVPIYRGFWVEGTTYAMGDQVTYGGSQWIARESTAVRPDESTDDGRRSWTLSTKRGREGKRGPQGVIGPPGPRGDR